MTKLLSSTPMKRSIFIMAAFLLISACTCSNNNVVVEQLTIDNHMNIQKQHGITIINVPANDEIFSGAITSNSAIHLIGEGNVFLNGSIFAPSVIIHGSNIVIMGSLVATQKQSTQAGILGGNILIQGTSVKVSSTALISTAAPRGDGSINIEAENSILVLKGAVLTADATQVGRGGRVRTFSKQTTFFGKATANAGPDGSGDGGFVEISGDAVHSQGGEYLALASVQGGVAGTVLFDPQLIEITSCAVPSATTCPGSNVYDPSGPPAGITDIDVADNNGFPAPPDNHNVQIHFLDVIASIASGINVVLRSTREIKVTDWPAACTPGQFYCHVTPGCAANCAACTAFTNAHASGLCTASAGPAATTLQLHAGKSVSIDDAFHTFYLELVINVNVATGGGYGGIDNVRFSTARGSGRSSVDINAALTTKKLTILDEDCDASARPCPDGDLTIAAAVDAANGVDIDWGGDVIISDVVTVTTIGIDIKALKESTAGTATKGSITISGGGQLVTSAGDVALEAAYHITVASTAASPAIDTKTGTGGAITMACSTAGTAGTITLGQKMSSETSIGINAAVPSVSGAITQATCSVVVDANVADFFDSTGGAGTTLAIGGKTVSIKSADPDINDAALTGVHVIAVNTITFDVTDVFTLDTAAGGDIRIETTAAGSEIILKGDGPTDALTLTSGAAGAVTVMTTKLKNFDAVKVDLVVAAATTGAVTFADVDETTKPLVIDMKGGISATMASAFTIAPSAHKVEFLNVNNLAVEQRLAAVGTMSVTATSGIDLTGTVDGCSGCAVDQAITLSSGTTTDLDAITTWVDVTTLTIDGNDCTFAGIAAASVVTLDFQHSGTCTQVQGAIANVIATNVNIEGKIAADQGFALTIHGATLLDVKADVLCDAAGSCDVELNFATAGTISSGVTFGSATNRLNLVLKGSPVIDHSTADITLYSGAGTSSLGSTAGATLVKGTMNALKINIASVAGYVTNTRTINAHTANHGIIEFVVTNGGNSATAKPVWVVAGIVGGTLPLLKVSLTDDGNGANTPQHNFISFGAATSILTLDIIKGAITAPSALTVHTLNLGTVKGGITSTTPGANLITIASGGVMNVFSATNTGANVFKWTGLTIDGPTGTQTINIYKTLGLAADSGPVKIDDTIELVNIYATLSIVGVHATTGAGITWEAQQTVLKGTSALTLTFDSDTTAADSHIIFGDAATTTASLALTADNTLAHAVIFASNTLVQIFDHIGAINANTATKISTVTFTNAGGASNEIQIDQGAIIKTNGAITTGGPTKVSHAGHLQLYSVSGNVEFGSGAIAAVGAITITAGGTISTTNIAPAGGVTAGGAITITATGAITLSNKVTATSGDIIITSGAALSFSAAAGTTITATAGKIELKSTGTTTINSAAGGTVAISAGTSIYFSSTVDFASASANTDVTITTTGAGDITFDGPVEASSAFIDDVTVTAANGHIIINGASFFTTTAATTVTLAVTTTTKYIKVKGNVGNVAQTGDLCVTAAKVLVTGTPSSLKAAALDCAAIDADVAGNAYAFTFQAGAGLLVLDSAIGGTTPIKTVTLAYAGTCSSAGSVTLAAAHDLTFNSASANACNVGSGGTNTFELKTTDTTGGTLTVNAPIEPSTNYDDTFKITAAYDLSFGSNAQSGATNVFINFVWVAGNKITYAAHVNGFVASDNTPADDTPDAFDITAKCMESTSGAMTSASDNAIKIALSGKCTIQTIANVGFYFKNKEGIAATYVATPPVTVYKGSSIEIKLTDSEAKFITVDPVAAGDGNVAKFTAQTGIVFNLAGDNYDLDVETQFLGLAFTYNYITLYPLAYPTYVLPAPGAFVDFTTWDGKVRLGFNVNMAKRTIDTGYAGADERTISTQGAMGDVVAASTPIAATDGTIFRAEWAASGDELTLGAGAGALKCAGNGCCVGIVWLPNLVAGWDWNDLYGQTGFVPHDFRPFPTKTSEIPSNQFKYCNLASYPAASVYESETRTVQFATTVDVDEINVYSVCGLISSQFMSFYQTNAHTVDQLTCTASAGSSIITVTLARLAAGTADAAVAVLSSVLSQPAFRAALETRNMGTTLYGTVIVVDGAEVIPIWSSGTTSGMKISNTPTQVGVQTTFTFQFTIPAAATSFTTAYQWRITLPANDFWWAPGTKFTVGVSCTGACAAAGRLNGAQTAVGTIDHTGHVLEFYNNFNTLDALIAADAVTLTFPHASSTNKVYMPQNCLNFNSWLYLVTLGHESDVPGVIYLGHGSDDRCQQQSVVIFGDPHFNSFSGGYYDISGRSGGIYTIITDEQFLWNSMFVAKPHADRAAMHTYLGLTGFIVFDRKITYDPNTDNATIDGELLPNSESRVTLTNSSSNFYVKKESNLMILRAPGFRVALKRVMHTHRQRLPHFDHAVDILRSEIQHPHGLLGQTASFKKPVKAVDHQGTGVIEGKLEHYEVNDVHSVHCLYNQYGLSTKQAATTKASNPTSTWADAWFKHEVIPHNTHKADGQTVKPAQRLSTFWVTPYSELRFETPLTSGSKISFIKHPDFTVIAMLDRVDGYSGKTTAVNTVLVKFSNGKLASYSAANNLTVNGKALDAGETAVITKIGDREYSATRMRVKNGGAVISVPGLDLYLRVDMIKGLRLGQQTEITDSAELAKMEGLMGAAMQAGIRSIDEDVVAEHTVA